MLPMRIFCFLLFCLPIFQVLQLGETRDPIIVSSFVFMIILFSYCLFVINIRGGSFFKVYFVFCYLFLGIIPLIEYRLEIVYWTARPLSDEAYLITNIMLIASTVIFLLSYLLTRNSKVNKYEKISTSSYSYKYELTLVHQALILTISAVCFFALLKINNFSMLSLMLRGGEFKYMTDIPRWQNTLIGTIARFAPIISFGYCLLRVRGRLLFKSLLLIVAIMCASPLGIARFMVATLYLPLIFILFPKIISGNKFPFLLLSAIFFVFPFLEKFRSFDKTDEFNFIPNFDFFLHGHFDSYQSIVRVIDESFVTYGEQLLGAILFFIPRFLWFDKPIGTGAQLAQDLNYDFTNISANIYAEGYANFGLIGFLLFALFLGFIFSKADYWFEYIPDKKPITIYLYYLMLGFLTMVLRGDLMTAISTSVGLFFCILLIKKLYPA